MSQNKAKIKIRVDGMNTYGSTYGEKLLYFLENDVIQLFRYTTVGKPPKIRKKAKKTKNGYFISSESQNTHLSEKSFRVLSSKVKRLSLVGISAKIKKIGPL